MSQLWPTAGGDSVSVHNTIVMLMYILAHMNLYKRFSIKD